MSTVIPAPDTRPAGAQHPARRAFEAIARAATSGIFAGAIAGAIAGGIGGRLAMRVTAIMATDAEQGSLTEAEERVGDITLEGTIAVILFGGILLGMLGGLVYAAMHRWFAGAGAWRGLTFGAFLFVTLGWTVVEGDNFDFATLGSVSVNLAMFVAIFLLFGVLVAPLYERIHAWLPTPSLRLSGLAALPLYAFAALAGVNIVALVGFGFGEGGWERVFYTIVPAYAIVVTAVAGALIARRASAFEQLSDLKGNAGATAAALAVIAPIVAVGIALDAGSIAEILADAY